MTQIFQLHHIIVWPEKSHFMFLSITVQLIMCRTLLVVVKPPVRCVSTLIICCGCWTTSHSVNRIDSDSLQSLTLHPYRMMLGCSGQVRILLKSPGVTLAPRLLLGNNHAEIAGRQPPQFIPRLFPLCYLSSSHPKLRCFRFYISNSNVSNWAESTRCRCLRRQILPLGPIWHNRMASLNLSYGPGKTRIWLKVLSLFMSNVSIMEQLALATRLLRAIKAVKLHVQTVLGNGIRLGTWFNLIARYSGDYLQFLRVIDQ